MPPEEIQRMEKEMQRTGPGGCSSREECDAFCRNPDNVSTCLNFAVQEGKITKEEADFMIEREMMKIGPPAGPRPPGKPRGPTIDMEKAKKLLDEIGGPGGCKTMEECDKFCGQPQNEETCFNYAVDNGLMPQAEIERVKKMKDTVGPGAARS